MAPTLGHQLKIIREARGISLEEISQKTHVRLAYLQAIETNNNEALPSQMHKRGFLRLYASFLNVELDGLEVTDYGTAPHPLQTPSAGALPEGLSDEGHQTIPEISKDEPATLKNNETEHPETETNAKTPLPEFTNPEPTLSLTSAEIFKDIGQQLFQRREQLSLSLDDIEKHLHLRRHYLTALETGQFEKLPSPVQSKGMLANYAEFLSLEVDSLLLYYADGLQKKRLESQMLLPGKKKAQTLSPNALKWKNFFSVDLIAITAIFLAFAAFVIWGVNRILTVDTPGIAPTNLPEVADVLLATISPTPQLTATIDGAFVVDGSETAPPPLFTPLPNDSPIAIVIIPRRQTWARVTVDEKVAFEGRLLPGNAYDYGGETQVEVLTGNAGAIQVLFNNEDLGIPGLLGQVANLIFNKSGLILPTPTSTPTVTETPQVTPTPSPTLTENQ